MSITDLEQEVARTLAALDQAGILTLLPRSGKPGVIGVDGTEYPAPDPEQLQAIFARNHQLVDRKMRQGFTQLQLTPIALPACRLLDRARAVILEHAAAGKINQTKQGPADADLPLRVHAGDPIWIWEQVRRALDTPHLVYFPQAYADRDHQGWTKDQVVQNTRFCALPGWSVGLIEPTPIVPQPGQGRVIGGRKELEASFAPREYVQTLRTSPYEGETGWTPEDFLTHWIARLETTDQVSHDRSDGNALWLLGAYLPSSMPHALLVPVGYWARAGGRLHLTAHRTGNRLKEWVARSMVRLGA